MSAHDHRAYVEGCFRCEISRDELDPRFDVEPNPESTERADVSTSARHKE